MHVHIQAYYNVNVLSVLARKLTVGNRKGLPNCYGMHVRNSFMDFK